MVKGKIYHCLKCNGTVVVEYDGGAMLTQVGENNIYQYYHLEDKYGSNKGANPNSEGVYIHEEAICEECVDKSRVLGETFLSSLEEIKRIPKLLRVKEKIHKIFSSNLDNINADWVISIDSLAFNKTLKEKNFMAKTVPRKRQNIIDNYLISIGDQLISKVLVLPDVDEYITKTASEADKIFAGHFLIIKDTVEKYDNQFYTAKDVSSQENLNDYICTEQTTRIPVSSTPKRLHYYGTSINVDAIAELKNRIQTIADINNFVEDKDYVRSIARGLRDILLKELENNKLI